MVVEWFLCFCPCVNEVDVVTQKLRRKGDSGITAQLVTCVLHEMTPLWVLGFALATLKLITILVQEHPTISIWYFDPQFMHLVLGSRLSICNLCLSTDFPQALCMFHLDLAFRCFWDWTDLAFFVKTQCRPIISSLSEIKKEQFENVHKPSPVSARLQCDLFKWLVYNVLLFEENKFCVRKNCANWGNCKGCFSNLQRWCCALFLLSLSDFCRVMLSTWILEHWKLKP